MKSEREKHTHHHRTVILYYYYLHVPKTDIFFSYDLFLCTNSSPQRHRFSGNPMEFSSIIIIIVIWHYNENRTVVGTIITDR